jgi:hypothetical protein
VLAETRALDLLVAVAETDFVNLREINEVVEFSARSPNKGFDALVEDCNQT